MILTYLFPGNVHLKNFTPLMYDETGNGLFHPVRIEGLEPPRLTAQDPKSCAATNYAISASVSLFWTCAFRCRGFVLMAVDYPISNGAKLIIEEMKNEWRLKWKLIELQRRFSLQIFSVANFNKLTNKLRKIFSLWKLHGFIKKGH